MEQTEVRERSANQADMSEPPANALSCDSNAGKSILPQAGNGECGCGGTAGSNPPSYVFVLGRVGWRFRSSSVEKEFAQATGRAETTGLTDRQAFYEVLSQRQNRYLVRQLCWVLTIEGLETYILLPRDTADFELLVEAVRPAPSPMDVDVVIGVRGAIAPPEVCNGLMVPIVVFDQLYSFDRDSLIQSIPRPDSIPADQEEQFRAASGELFDRNIAIRNELRENTILV